MLDTHRPQPTPDSHPDRRGLDSGATDRDYRSPTLQVEEPLVWPDPSPLHDWWIDVMTKRGRDAAH
ncbi:hypothetical protein [Rhodococcus triatomae]|nr:hypothetical protein G419_23024 [Rhodococcus triatomae BKS 15-14]